MKLAVVVALIPQDIVLVISFNKSLSSCSKDFFLLNKKDFLPHISLAMGVIDKKDFYSIKKVLSSLSKKHSPIDICFSDVKVYRRSDAVGSVFKIKKSSGLQALRTCFFIV